MKRILFVVLGLLGMVVAIAAVGLAWAHVAIRRERPALPTVEAVKGIVFPEDAPIRLAYINTASQPMPRSVVLDRGADARPKAPYVMSHSAFVLEWRDGRLLLVDLGMTRAGAESFGRLLELFGAERIRPLASVAERLGSQRARVAGVIFTHLHVDHVGGIADLCDGMSHPVRAYMTPSQANRDNYTTRPGRRILRSATCVQTQTVGGGPLAGVPEFPGVYIIAGAGHTPCSQIVVALVNEGSRPRRYVLAGDVANNLDGITGDVPKPFLYSLLIVPEDRPRLHELRELLRTLGDEAGTTVVVTHDQLALEKSGIPAW